MLGSPVISSSRYTSERDSLTLSPKHAASLDTGIDLARRCRIASNEALARGGAEGNKSKSSAASYFSHVESSCTRCETAEVSAVERAATNSSIVSLERI